MDNIEQLCFSSTFINEQITRHAVQPYCFQTQFSEVDKIAHRQSYLSRNYVHVVTDINLLFHGYCLAFKIWTMKLPTVSFNQSSDHTQTMKLQSISSKYCRSRVLDKQTTTQFYQARFVLGLYSWENYYMGNWLFKENITKKYCNLNLLQIDYWISRF